MMVYVPGHVRGQYTMPGAEDAGHHAPKPVLCGDFDPAKQSPAQSNRPTEDQKRRCHVCYLAAGYTVATSFHFEILLACHSLQRDVLMREQQRQVEFAFPFYPSGPPANA